MRSHRSAADRAQLRRLEARTRSLRMRRSETADRRVQHGQDREHRRSPRGRARRDRRPRVPGVPPRTASGSREPSSATAANRPRAARPVRRSVPGALHLWESEYLLRHPPTPAAPWTVITTVREPIAQAVSAFFHGAGGAARSTSDRRGRDAHRATLVDERLDPRAAALVRPGVRARRSGSTCSSIRSTPTSGTA